MGKIEQNREKKRTAILNAAQETFLSQGFIQASMDKIAVQAKVTKQTVYRYFPSKIDLFKATLQHMGGDSQNNFFITLEKPEIAEALQSFAESFIHTHLSETHLCTMRLLIAESAKAPEVTSTFFSVCPSETEQKLTAFFKDRLGLADPQKQIDLWTAMLLSFRTTVLLGMPRPTDEEITEHAKAATAFLLASQLAPVKPTN